MVFHGISINYLPSEFIDPRIKEINFGGISINYLPSEFADPRPILPQLYGINIVGYTHPNLIETTTAGSTSKKVYITDKGNIMINPNDTILIEI